MKFSVTNLGCKVNAFETESIADMLEKAGYERSDDPSGNDICIIFTCAVTNTAAAKSRQMIHRAKRSNPDGILVVAGCYAQIDPDALDSADILVGSTDKMKIPAYIGDYLEKHQKIRGGSDLENAGFEPMTVDRFARQTRAYLRIQDGCNQFCSYCIIPYARGRERSMTPDMAVQEAVRLSQSHKEIVLTGIHTGRYGREYGVSLAQLMKRMLNAAPELERLRISSIEITELDDEFVSLMKEEKRIARHLHIPLQAGSDRILELMRRPYDTAGYYARMEEIRNAVEDLSVSCDLMTGFPSETEQEHRDALAFARKCRFSFMHVFPYSAREGTPAAGMADQIDPQIKKRRASECLELSGSLYDAYKDTWTGRQAEVICETFRNGYTRGYTSQYLPVQIEGREEPGTLLKVLLTERRGHMMYGKKVLI